MNIDWTVLQWIRDTFTCGFLDFIMPKISWLGNVGAIWFIAAIALIFIRKYKNQGIMLLIALSIGVLVCNVALKNIVARPRPCWLDENVMLLIANPKDYSFPSGHTLSSVIGATVLTLTNRKFGWVAIPLAALIAFSRLYLYVHFPSDVVGAIFIGLILGIAVFYAGNAAMNKAMSGRNSQVL